MESSRFFLEEDNSNWIASSSDFPELVAYGSNKESAINQLKQDIVNKLDAIKDDLEALTYI